MVKRAEAPRPGWYPDPTGRSGLLWWDGSDWTRHRRPAPPASHEPPAAQGEQGGDRADRSRSSAHDASRAGTTPALQQQRRTEREVGEAVAEARRVAKAEVERAVSQATRQLTGTRDRWQPRIEQYVRRLKRWVKVIAVAAVVLFALSSWASATMQTSLLQWLGERIDAATATVAGGWAAGDLGI